MNSALIGELVRLRYKLLWAKTRSRNGRIALFLAGYLLLVMLVALLSTGGFGAAMLAVRSGKAEAIARGVLSVLFLEAVLAANILGFGMSAIFSETELRRYPLTAADRRTARHLTGILDPFWFLFLALELGLMVGLYVLGAGSFWFGLLGVLLLFAANYLLARVVGLFIDQLMQRKGGAAILLALIMILAFVPALAGPVIRENPAILSALLLRLQYTPPFGAAAAMIHADLAGARGLGITAAWILGLGALLVWLEKRPPQRQTTESVKIEWDSPFDRVGALFGPQMGPLVGHWLRFYGRNNRTRMLYLLALPLLTFVTFQMSERLGPYRYFIIALGTIPMATFLGTSRISVNQFGYVGGAFRRYFLLPIDPAATLRAASYAAVTIGASVLPIALLAFAILVPYGGDARILLMLLCSGVTGLFVLNGLGVWVTLFNPRKGNYNSNFGNDLSLGGNILLIGGMMLAMFLPRLLHKFQPALVSPESWWIWLPLPLLAVVFYRATLKSAGPIFVTRREKLLAIVEGRD
ncbi:MAG: hypothetical protein NTW28_03010 [Candidatus Solibacter sp.]|nr:hypothetical protein [Candidatus Solibacter sp.]